MKREGRAAVRLSLSSVTGSLEIVSLPILSRFRSLPVRPSETQRYPESCCSGPRLLFLKSSRSFLKSKMQARLPGEDTSDSQNPSRTCLIRSWWAGREERASVVFLLGSSIPLGTGPTWNPDVHMPVDLAPGPGCPQLALCSATSQHLLRHVPPLPGRWVSVICRFSQL